MELNDATKDTTGEAFVSLTPDKRIPRTLRRELTTMRRDPDGFSVVRMVKCGPGCGKGKAYSLTHAESENAGSWCPNHGWLFFDSVALPPTERLRASEVEERRQGEQRRAQAAIRQANKEQRK
jgi:hypothetical protein